MKYSDLEKYYRRQNRLKQQPRSVVKHLDNFNDIQMLISKKESFCLVGVKDTDYINHSFLDKMIEKNFIPHTIDKMSRGGRAVDIDLINPITCKVMTGSSSGTAINVLEDINDIGVGTDGGGSVLAPAMALNLYGIISPLFFRDESFTKKSTDGITFVPSIGLISKDIDLLKEATRIYIPSVETSNIEVLIPSKNNNLLETGQDIHEIIINNLDRSDLMISEAKYPNIFGDREINISFLQDMLPKYDVLISYEGPVDYYGLGDSVFGLFNDIARQEQQKSMKGLIRVANMVNASALTVPSNDFSSGYVLIANSTPRGIQALFEIEKRLKNKMNNPLYNRYFNI